MKGVPIRRLGLVAVGFPLFGVLFVLIWSILYDFEASVRTICHVPNFLPTVSSAIGGFTPQRYVWRICITLQAGLRFMLAYCYYQWYLRVDVGKRQFLYTQIVKFAVFCHVVENLALVTLSSVSSTDNANIHEYSFIAFMVCSQIYMLVSCGLIRWTHKSVFYKVTSEDQKNLWWKMILFVFNVVVFLLSVYFFVRHNKYCEPNIYSWFALGEYLTIFSNIAFHGMCYYDFKMYSFTFLATEDVQTGMFKNS